MNRIRLRWYGGAAAALAIVIALTIVFGQAIARAAIVAGVAWATGLHPSFGQLVVGSDRLVARDVHVTNAAGETVADVGALSLGYSLRDLLPGGSRAFGLRSLDVENAHVAVTRHADGTLNVTLPSAGGGASAAPLVFRGRIRNASLDVYDLTQPNGRGRHLAFGNAFADLDVATNARSRYRAGLTYVEDGRTYPISGYGDVDVPGGYGIQRWSSNGLPIARLVNAALDSPQLRLSGGRLRSIEARIVGLPDASGAFTQHVTARAQMENGRIAIGGLAQPVRNVRGRIAVYGNGLLLDGVTATLAGLPMRFDGGVYNLAKPHVYATMATHGDLNDLRAVLPQTAHLPLRGPIQLDIVAEGAATKPLVEIALRSQHATYETYGVSRMHALLAYDGHDVDVVNARTTYAGIAVAARGHVSTRTQPNGIEMLAGFDTPSSSLPYASGVLPNMLVHGVIVATGDRPSRVTARGAMYGAGSSATLAAVFDLRSNGAGVVGPIHVQRAGQSLYAIAAMDRPKGPIDAYLRADAFRVSLPRFAATVDANVAGKVERSTSRLAGLVDLRDVRTPSGSVADVRVRFGQNSRAALAAGIEASGIGAMGGIAAATLGFDRGTLHVDDAAIATRDSFADAHGNVTNLQHFAPRYDLWTSLHTANLASVVQLVRPSAAGLVEGSAKARLHVTGSGSTPFVEGTAQLPEGAVNGLAFHDLRASVSGTPASIALREGTVGIGSTDVAFDAVASSSSQRLDVASSRADLADFNDFFDTGDMFGGEGQVRAAVALTGGVPVSTSGSVRLHDASLRGFDFGAADADWSGGGERVATTIALRGPNGRVSASGSVGLSGSVNLTAHAREMDVSRWAALGGLTLPVAGIADADVTAVGRYPNLDARLNASLAHGSAGRIPIERLTIAARTSEGRGSLERATLVIPNARVTGSGTFGMRPGDPLDVAFHATSPNVAALAATAFGKTFDAAGALDTTLRVRGSLRNPALDDRFALTNAHYGSLEIPHAIGTLHADQRSVSLDTGELDLRKGRVLARATVPIRAVPFAIDPHDRPIDAVLVADDVEASNVAAMLPKGTTATGRVDGRVALAGSVRAPRLSGEMTLAKGYFSGPQERVPITDATGTLRFSGTTAHLENVRANAGGGTLSADGSASISNVRDLGRLAMALNLHARNARLDLPQYVKGRFNGDVALTRAPGAQPVVSGTIALDSARVAMTALYNPKASNPNAKPPPVGVNLGVALGRDVRVVSPNVDVGVAGSVHAKGSLAAPQLAGTFTSTGGTVNFFRDFRVQNATVSFDPSSGIIPDVDATATTFIDNPQTNVALRVTGPATNLNIAFASDPEYDREQILGLLVNAQSLGAVRGVASTNGGSFSAHSAVTSLAAGQIDTLFTRNLLEPMSVALGGSLGLENLQLTTDIQGGLGLNAVKALGKDVSFVFADTFNQARRQSWSLDVHPSDRTQLELTAYSSQNSSLLGFTPLLVQGLAMGNAATIPLDTGTNGVDFKLGRKFP